MAANLTKGARGRTNKSIDPLDLTSRINELIASDGGLSAAYAKVLKLSERMAGLRGATYIHRPYQCYMAAKIAVDGTSKFTAAVIGPGQGKTFVMLLLAHYLLDEGHTERVALCSSSDLVHQQLSEDKRNHPPPKGNVVVLHCVDFRGSLANGTHFILDEGDLYLRDKLLAFHGDEQVGLGSLRGKSVWLFTATLNDYWEGVWKDGLAGSVLAFQDLLSLVG